MTWFQELIPHLVIYEHTNSTRPHQPADWDSRSSADTLAYRSLYKVFRSGNERVNSDLKTMFAALDNADNVSYRMIYMATKAAVSLYAIYRWKFPKMMSYENLAAFEE